MITAVHGDITKVGGVEYICNAANGIGPMGAGVAGAIRRAGGIVIQEDAIRVCKLFDPREGSLYVTTAGILPYKGVIHLVTMKNPGGITGYNIVRTCLHSLISFCHSMGVKSVALPALGTGVGGLSPKIVADIFIEELLGVPNINFVVVDIDKKFIDYFSHI